MESGKVGKRYEFKLYVTPGFYERNSIELRAEDNMFPPFALDTTKALLWVFQLCPVMGRSADLYQVSLKVTKNAQDFPMIDWVGFECDLIINQIYVGKRPGMLFVGEVTDFPTSVMRFETQIHDWDRGMEKVVPHTFILTGRRSM